MVLVVSEMGLGLHSLYLRGCAHEGGLLLGADRDRVRVVIDCCVDVDSPALLSFSARFLRARPDGRRQGLNSSARKKDFAAELAEVRRGSGECEREFKS